jgi:hypothetical protein
MDTKKQEGKQRVVFREEERTSLNIGSDEWHTTGK